MSDFNGRARALSVGAITVVGAVLRVFDPSAAQYGPDEVTMTSLAMGIASLERFPTGVNASVIVPHGPLAPYAVAPIAVFSHAQAALLFGFAVYNTAAIPLMYSLGRDLFGRGAGLLAAALFAVNPWLVVFGRWLEPNAIIAPTAVFFLWALHGALQRRTLGGWAAAGVALALTLQAHLSSLPNGLALIGLAPFSRGAPKRALALAGGIALVLMAPWLVGGVWPAIWPTLQAVDFSALGSSRTWSLNSLMQASQVVTGSAYRAIADAPLCYLDALAPPFSWLDLAARGLALAGWVNLLRIAWTERQRPAAAATCLVASLMVALPVLLLARPIEAGNIAFLYVHEFINVAPPLLLGIAALTTSVAVRFLRRLATALGAAIVAGQLMLAVVFYATPQTEWKLGDFSIPYRFTQALVQAMGDRATITGAPVMVGGEGYEEQGKLAYTLLRLDYPMTRLHDGRDGIVFWADAPTQVLVTTRDQHSMSRFLRREFSAAQVFGQELPGTGRIRRVFEVATPELDRWASGRLSPVSGNVGPSAVTYERAALLPPLAQGDGPTLATLWRFASEPTDPFFTDIVLLSVGQEVFRERHVAYPIAFWEPGDWQRMRVLNLFDLPVSLDPATVTEVRLEHVGILTGRQSVPTLSFSPNADGRDR